MILLISLLAVFIQSSDGLITFKQGIFFHRDRVTHYKPKEFAPIGIPAPLCQKGRFARLSSFMVADDDTEIQAENRMSSDEEMVQGEVFDEDNSDDLEEFDNSSLDDRQREANRLVSSTILTSFENSITLLDISWVGDRCIVTVDSESDNDDDASKLAANSIGDVSRRLIEVFNDPDVDAKLDITNRYEILVSTRGFDGRLVTPKEFTAYKGFDVEVQTDKAYPKNKGKDKVYLGRLVEKTDDAVRLNVKGRISKIPLKFVLGVKLPKAKVEKGDGGNVFANKSQTRRRKR